MRARPLAIRPETVNLIMPLITGNSDVDEVTEVRRFSPRPHRIAVRKIAQFFRREFQYDFVQYHEDEDDRDSRDTAYLWVHPEAACHCNDLAVFRVPCIGACCFRWREWTNIPHGFALAWVWFHRYWRGRGLLSKEWPDFEEKFGNFHVEGPISPAMKSFLAKHERVTP